MFKHKVPVSRGPALLHFIMKRNAVFMKFYKNFINYTKMSCL